MANTRRGLRRARRWLLMLGAAGFAAGATVVARSSSPARQARGHHSTPPSAQAQHAGHETEDIDPGAAVAIFALMAFSTVLVIGIVWVTIWRFDTARRESFSHITRLQSHHVEPPLPHLEVNPLAALARNVTAQKHLLETYGWANGDHTLARIPINRAMALTVGKSLDAAP